MSDQALVAPRPAARTAEEIEAWRNHWYPLALGQDLAAGDVRRVSVHDEALALFRDDAGVARSVLDRCPHRGARLSDGRVESGRLECLYHGWQFAGDGRCTEIPQLRETQPIPKKACVSAFTVKEVQGLIWVWLGRASEADPAAIPTIEALDVEHCKSIDFAIDLPYEQTFLIENVIDIAHIHVAHDGVRGGGHRHLASAIEFEISERAAGGFSGSYRSESSGDGPALKGARVEFRAPNLVHYRSLYQEDELISGLALYSLPLGQRRCRLIYRAYSNFWPLRARLRPRFVEHWTQCTILEQDMDVVVGQSAEHLAGHAPKDLWLPLRSSDGFVLAYRRWLDEYAADWPYAVGFAKARADDRVPEPYDRHRMHTALCSSCSRALKICHLLRRAAGGAFVLLLLLTAGFAQSVPGLVFGVLSSLAAALYWGCGHVANRFRSSHVRQQAETG